MNKRPPRNGEIVEKIQHTLLVDGNALYKTSLFGAKDKYNQDGQHIGGLYQFLTTLRMVLNNDLYHRVFVFWDGNFSGKLRYNIYEPYKSGRGKDYINGTQPVDESELAQRRLLWDYLNELYIRQLKHEVIEGDDFIAYYCLKRKRNEKITIISNDRDMCQLIDENVRVYFCDRQIKNYVDPENYSKYFDHDKSNSLLLKTITGDVSDTIKGIKGVKEKTLLSLFPEIKDRKVTINEIIESAKKQQQARLDKKEKPLLALTNLINCVTVGVQGKQLYEINHKLVDLKNPLMTEDGIRELEHLIEGAFDPSVEDFKNVLSYMKRDGLVETIGEYRMTDYLIPFKKLIDREKQLLIN